MYTYLGITEGNAMIAAYCTACQRVTGHKRSIGVGTYIGGIFTLGASFFAIPLYPKRCVVCGLSSQDTAQPHDTAVRYCTLCGKPTANATCPANQQCKCSSDQVVTTNGMNRILMTSIEPQTQPVNAARREASGLAAVGKI